jgi:hypothetical protein
MKDTVNIAVAKYIISHLPRTKSERFEALRSLEGYILSEIRDFKKQESSKKTKRTTKPKKTVKKKIRKSKVKDNFFYC